MECLLPRTLQLLEISGGPSHYVALRSHCWSADTRPLIDEEKTISLEAQASSEVGLWKVEYHNTHCSCDDGGLHRQRDGGIRITRGLPERGPMNIGQIVSELKKERDDLNRAIAALEGIGGRRPQTGKISEKGSTAQTSRKRRRGLSAAGRRRISEAMKKRWAERRAKVTPVRKSAKAA